MAEQERIPPEILRKVRKIELATRHRVDDLFGGAYHSVFKGTGMEFDEVREYAAGDEVRSIDWNVTARMGRPFIKRYREERELTVLLVVDASASGLFGSRERLKSEVIAEVASVLAFSAIRNQDKVGCLIFTDRVEQYIPPEKGHRHVLRIIRELLYVKPEGSGTDLGGALETVRRLLKRKAVVFLVSDFMAPDFETPLRLAARRHDLVALNIRDRLEGELPDVGLLQVRDAESGERVWLDTSNRWVRKHFAEEAAARDARFSQLCGKNGVDEIRLDPAEDYARPLVQFFRKRAKRLAKGIGRARGWLLPALLAASLAAGTSPTRAQIQQAPPMPQGQPGPAGQAQAPSFTIIPRAALDSLALPSLAQLTGAGRPRLDQVDADGLRIDTRLERDLQAIGQPNALRWRVVLPEGAALDSLAFDLGAPGRILPLPRTGDVDQAEALAARQAAGERLALHDFVQADTLRGAGADTLVYQLPFTVTVPDTFEIPGQTFRYRLAGDDAPRALVTHPLELACVSSLAAGPDSSALHDWKAPGALRADWAPLLARWGLPGLLLLLVAALALLWWLRRRARRLAPEVPPTPADVEALAALDALAQADLPGQGAWAEYYFQLSQIVRRYLTRHYALPFADWTTDEIRDALEGSPFAPRRLQLDPTLVEPLMDDLERGDLVKFARREPTRAECQASMQAAKRLVLATRPPAAEHAPGDDPAAPRPAEAPA